MDMSIASTGMDEADLRAVDEGILDELARGRANAPYLSEQLDYSQQYIRERLGTLKRDGHVVALGHGLYEAGSDPRTVDDGGTHER